MNKFRFGYISLMAVILFMAGPAYSTSSVSPGTSGGGVTSSSGSCPVMDNNGGFVYSSFSIISGSAVSVNYYNSVSSYYNNPSSFAITLNGAISVNGCGEIGGNNINIVQQGSNLFCLYCDAPGGIGGVGSYGWCPTYDNGYTLMAFNPSGLTNLPPAPSNQIYMPGGNGSTCIYEVTCPPVFGYTLAASYPTAATNLPPALSNQIYLLGQNAECLYTRNNAAAGGIGGITGSGGSAGIAGIAGSGGSGGGNAGITGSAGVSGIVFNSTNNNCPAMDSNGGYFGLYSPQAISIPTVCAYPSGSDGFTGITNSIQSASGGYCYYCDPNNNVNSGGGACPASAINCDPNSINPNFYACPFTDSSGAPLLISTNVAPSVTGLCASVHYPNGIPNITNPSSGVYCAYCDINNSAGNGGSAGIGGAAGGSGGVGGVAGGSGGTQNNCAATDSNGGYLMPPLTPIVSQLTGNSAFCAYPSGANNFSGATNRVSQASGGYCYYCDANSSVGNGVSTSSTSTSSTSGSSGGAIIPPSIQLPIGTSVPGNSSASAATSPASYKDVVQQNASCGNILSTCQNAGYVQGGWANDNGLWADCVNPMLNGTQSLTKLGKSTSVLLDQSHIQACHNAISSSYRSIVQQNPSCANILNACKNAGFVQGGWANDDGLWADCVNPILTGATSLTRMGKSVSVPVNQSDVQACHGAVNP